ncbi:hypothetical protein QZH41_015595, partial [Actinostola sp. cb2023]
MAADMLKNPRKKKGAKNIPKESPFPVPIESITKKECCDSRWFYYTGYFRDNCVVVEDLGDLTFLYKMGFFGKGNLSRSKPEYEMISDISQKAFSNSEKLRRLPPKERQIRQSKFREIRKERFKNHLEWQKSLKDRNLSKTQDSSNNVQCTQDEKLHVLEQDLAWPSSSNAKTDTLSDRDVCKKRKIDEQEPEINEAFFLSYGLGCLTVYDDDKKALTLSEMWQSSVKQRRTLFLVTQFITTFVQRDGFLKVESNMEQILLFIKKECLSITP